MKIQYMQGRDVCERCGAYIKNIFVITFNDGYSLRVGSECVKRVLRETNLTEKGRLYVERVLRPVEKTRQQLAMWQGMTYEKALSRHLLTMVWDDEANAHRDQTPEEFKETMERTLGYLSRRLREEETAANKVLETKAKNVRLKR